jgi:hypothetical protein
MICKPEKAAAQMGKFYLLSALLFFSHCIIAQTTYTWNVAGGGDWQVPTNWSSVPLNNPRTTPAPDDILIFNNGISATITNVPVETIGQLQVSNNTSIILVRASSGVNLTINGPVTIAAGSLLALDATLVANGAVSVDGSYQINEGGWATGTGTWTYGAAGTLIFNNSSGPYNVNNDVFWPVVNGPFNVTVQNTGGIIMNVPRTINGLFQTGDGANNSNNLTFNGTCQINFGGFLDLAPTYGPSSTLVYNAIGVLYGRGNEWSTTSGPGYPANVTINAGAELNLGNGGGGTARQISGNLLVNGGLYMDVNPDDMTEPLTVLGNVTIGSTGTLSLSDLIGGDLKVRGNWNLDVGGTFNPRNRAVYFEGNFGNQTITGATTFDYLLIDKAAGNLVLNSPVTVNQLLTFTSGKIVTSATNLLTLIDNASYAGASLTRFVDGPMKKIGDENFTFPVGLGTIYAPVSLTDGNNAAITDEFTVEYLRINPQSTYGNTYLGSINHVSFVEHWTINRNAASIASKRVSLDVHPTSFCLVPATTFVSRYNGTAWTEEPSVQSGFGPCGAYQCGTITTVSPITSFSPFTLATTDPFAINPLPIKLVRFDAVKQSASRALVSWELAACCSKEARFELEKSTDGRRYTLLTTLAGSETSRFYNYTDNDLAPGVNYFRLKATDEAGAVTYSRVATVINADGELLRVSLSPNPAGSQAMLVVTAAKNTMMQFSIISSSGVVMRQWQQRVLAGTQTTATDLQALPAGVYQLLGRGEGERVSLQFVKL